MSDQSPRRVRIVSPRSRATRASARRPVGREIGEQTLLGEVYMASLVRIQLRLAIGVLLIFAVLVGGLPLLLVLEPGLADVHVLGLPLPWLLLGVVVHPVIVVGALFYVRQSERNEHDFADLVERS
ncbi:MAG TPA: hypothetical protein VF227_10375 [Actinomycetes bacterium]|jgi:hypothetical protein